jgi:hypothetical protein
MKQINQLETIFTEDSSLTERLNDLETFLLKGGGYKIKNPSCISGGGCNSGGGCKDGGVKLLESIFYLK